MRLEDLEKESYIKSADSVERYLLDIIRQFFVDHVTVPETSRESFIIDALEMMKSEFDFEGLGVLSITLPSGETRVGNVTITLDDLNGEPQIPVKYSAFNVNFGDKANTACEGNDPRLSDARVPIAHTHQISEIYGLEGILNTINARIGSIDSLAHSHTNKNVLDKLVYTGTKSIIDLTIIDTLEDEVRDAINDVNARIAACCSEVEAAIEDINNKIENLNNRVDDLITYVNNQNAIYLNDLKAYVDDLYENYFNNMMTYASTTFATKAEVLPLVDVANECYIFAARDEWLVNRDLTWTTSFKSISTHYATCIMDEMALRGQHLKDVLLDMYFLYIENGKTTKIPVPYTVYSDDGDIKGTISANVITDGASEGQVVLDICCLKTDMPSKILSGKFIVDAYSKRPLTLASYTISP